MNNSEPERMASMRIDATQVANYNETRLPSARHRLCHAPFANLYFHQSGEVLACCFGREFPLGRYPQNSIAEIWNSTQLANLRESILKNELPGPCAKCGLHLVARSYHLTLARLFDDFAELTTEAPCTLEFDLSNACNLECVMCSGERSSLIRRNREKLPPLKNPYDDAFVAQLEPLWKSVKLARFVGGEPFLNPLYFKIWRQISELRLETQVSITTNATIFNRQVESVLETVRPYMVLSIDSLQKATFEKIRQNASFDTVMSNVHRFLGHGFRSDRALGISVCPMTLNCDEIPDIFDWGTSNFMTVHLSVLEHPADLSLRSLDSPRLTTLIERYQNHNLRTWRDVHADAPPWLRELSDGNSLQFKSLIEMLRSELKGRSVKSGFDRAANLRQSSMVPS